MHTRGTTLLGPAPFRFGFRGNKNARPPRDGFVTRGTTLLGALSCGESFPLGKAGPLLTGTNIPAPGITGGEPGQAYSQAEKAQSVLVAGSGGMFGWFVGTWLTPIPGSLGFRPSLLVSVHAFA